MADVKKLAEELVNLKVTEVNELAQISSSSQSEASLQAARELLSVARR